MSDKDFNEEIIERVEKESLPKVVDKPRPDFPPRLGISFEETEFMDAHFYKIEQAGGLIIADTEYLSIQEHEHILKAEAERTLALETRCGALNYFKREALGDAEAVLDKIENAIRDYRSGKTDAEQGK